MKLFKGEGFEYIQKKIKKDTTEEDRRKQMAMEGIQKILECGFLRDETEDIEYTEQRGKISIRSEMFTFAQKELEGPDLEMLEELDRFFKKNVIKEGYLPGRNGELNYEPKALLDIAAFILGNRDMGSDEPIYIDCIHTGIEITCKAAEEGERNPGYAGALMQDSLMQAIETCVKYKNGYPLITYDENTKELTAAILVPPLFLNRKKTKADLQCERDAAEKATREKRIKYLG